MQVDTISNIIQQLPVLSLYHVAGVQVVDQVAGVQVVDQVAGAQMVDRVAGTRVVDQVAGAQVVDQVAGAQMVDQVAGTQVVDQVAGAQVVDQVAGAQVLDQVAGASSRGGGPSDRSSCGAWWIKCQNSGGGASVRSSGGGSLLVRFARYLVNEHTSLVVTPTYSLSMPSTTAHLTTTPLAKSWIRACNLCYVKFQGCMSRNG